MTLRIYTDGGARGNPGEAAVGFLIYKINLNNGLQTELCRMGKTIGVATNNVAEYKAVIEALIWVKTNLGKELEKEKDSLFEFKLDSKLVASQLSGTFKIKDPNLRLLLVNVYNLVGALKTTASYTYIPREENQAADLEVNLALDAKLA